MKDASKKHQWVVSQLGAREHYGVARALLPSGMLAALLTDFWMPDSFASRLLPRSLRGRYHPNLRAAKVTGPFLPMLLNEWRIRRSPKEGWDAILTRNRQYQDCVSKHVERTLRSGDVFFSYSYTAKKPFQIAKKKGAICVLGQIDPGLCEAAIVEGLREAYPQWASGEPCSPPQEYWDDWREECDLADHVIANSEWSKRLLVQGGIQEDKISVIPLPFESSVSSQPHEKRANTGAPLKLLFLGQVLLRKGVHDLVYAARMLSPACWQIDIVGPYSSLPDNLPANIRFHGRVPRSAARDWYSQADVFVLPTHSDGFALTQLEAMSAGLPVLATPCCGDVVEDGVSGWIVPPGDPQALAETLTNIHAKKESIPSFSSAAKSRSGDFSFERFGQSLLESTRR